MGLTMRIRVVGITLPCVPLAASPRRKTLFGITVVGFEANRASCTALHAVVMQTATPEGFGISAGGLNSRPEGTEDGSASNAAVPVEPPRRCESARCRASVRMRTIRVWLTLARHRRRNRTRRPFADLTPFSQRLEIPVTVWHSRCELVGRVAGGDAPQLNVYKVCAPISSASASPLLLSPPRAAALRDPHALFTPV